MKYTDMKTNCYYYINCTNNSWIIQFKEMKNTEVHFLHALSIPEYNHSKNHWLCNISQIQLLREATNEEIQKIKEFIPQINYEIY